MYTLTAQAANAGDDLTISLATQADNGSSAHVLLVGAAVGIVPEPTTLTIFCAGLGLLNLLRRRQSSIRLQQGP
jgi:hypothetical protein